LRGGSRAAGGREVLAYYRGGFAELADALAARLREMGVEIRLSAPVTAIEASDRIATAVRLERECVPLRALLLTQALPQIAELFEGHADVNYLGSLTRIAYLANICLVLVLDRSLSETYWLNVNDPSFPFVGV